jgi:hypothetical protein
MNPKLTSTTTKKHLLTKQRERGWGRGGGLTERGETVAGRCSATEVGAARAGSGSGGGGPGRARAAATEELGEQGGEGGKEDLAKF